MMIVRGHHLFFLNPNCFYVGGPLNFFFAFWQMRFFFFGLLLENSSAVWEEKTHEKLERERERFSSVCREEEKSSVA